jgi:mannose-6-phosphate isomerase-like protein (cupin superfamily)
VYFEPDPGTRRRHTRTIRRGSRSVSTARDRRVGGDATGAVGVDELLAIPALTPHGVHNEGTETARFLGFFSDSTTGSEFETAVEPSGTALLRSGHGRDD